jgi:DNA replication and repair protein RecF
VPIINSLNIAHFRNLDIINTEFSPRFNILYGNNGSGKTSFLEAIYCLGLGKSFRANQFNKVIQHEAESCQVVAKINNDGNESMLGIERNINGTRQIKLDGETQASIAPITKLMPIQFMSPISYRFFHDGPKTRRQYLDWGLFHVKHTFLDLWQSLQRILKQRNSALKQKQDVSAWNNAFITAAEHIDQVRKEIFLAMEPFCLKQLNILLPGFSFKLRYQRGWPKNADLTNLLSQHLYRDQQLGYTYYGPQRADFQLLCDTTPIQDVFSQGQQKLAAYALHLALGQLLQEETQNQPIYLIDDLPSELDNTSKSRIAESLISLNTQSFITGISKRDLDALQALIGSQTFHVKHGTLASR